MYKILITLVLALVAGYLYFDFHTDRTHSMEIAEDFSPIKTWKKFIPSSGKFSVQLPSIPQYAIDVVNVPNTDIKRWYEIYVADELDGTVYMINLITYHPDFDMSNVEDLLHNVVNEVASSNLNNHVSDLADTTIDGRKGVSFHIKNQSFQAKGVAFLVGSTVYLLTYTGTVDNFNETEYKTFIDSFELLKESNEENKVDKPVEKHTEEGAVKS